MKRAQASTFSLEEFMKIGISVFVAIALFAIGSDVYAAVTQDKDTGSIKNSIENIQGLIKAQDEQFSVNTFITLGSFRIMAGMGEEPLFMTRTKQTAALRQGGTVQSEQVPVETNCVNCICVFEFTDKSVSLLECFNMDRKITSFIISSTATLDGATTGSWIQHEGRSLNCNLLTISGDKTSIQFQPHTSCLI